MQGKVRWIYTVVTSPMTSPNGKKFCNGKKTSGGDYKEPEAVEVSKEARIVWKISGNEPLYQRNDGHGLK